MLNNMESGMPPVRQRSSVAVPMFIGLGSFAIGAVLTFGYVQWQEQQQQLAVMTQMVQQMQERDEPEIVTRAATASIATLQVPTNLQTSPVAVTPVSIQVEPAVSSQVALRETTADRVRALVARSSDPLVSAAIAQSVARRETMSVAVRGVNE